MNDQVSTALALIRDLRSARGISEMSSAARGAFLGDLDRVERALGAPDAYAQVLDVLDLQNRLRSSGGTTAATPTAAPASQPPPQPAAKQTAEIGQRAGDALAAIDFPGFVASLLTGTFQAIVDASAQQIRAYAELVASITQSLDDFSADKVTEEQARAFLANRHSKDLVLVAPPPGKSGALRLLPRASAEGSSPDWLKRYDLVDAELSEELTDGPLVAAGRRQVGEERLQTLATMVLMGINRVVVNDGDVRAKLQFHAAAMDRQQVQVDQQSMGIAGRQVSPDQRTQMMVSTVKVNAQADAAIKADLMGEVRISFRTETFPLERFADSAAIQLINRHARWQSDQDTGSSPRPSNAAPTAPQTSAAVSAPTDGAGSNTSGGGA